MEENTKGKYLIIIGITVMFLSMFTKLIWDSVTKHPASYAGYTVVWFISAIVIAIGFMMFRSQELEEHIKESNLKINKEFKAAKEKERKKDDFREYLDGFSKEEIEVIEFLHTYEGTQKIALEKNVSYSKAKLDKVLNKLDEEKVIEIMPSGKLYLLKMSK